MGKTEWFEDWFDSKYYHILYKDRNLTEAEAFIDNLLMVLKPSKKANILDLACGKGRYSIHLAKKGFNVTGVDLSLQSIKKARLSETDNLSFFTHDMRETFRDNSFDYIFNFFTSFGYFTTEEDHLKTLKGIKEGLKKNGTFVIDFFNAHQVIANLKAREQKTVNGIKFIIRRKVKDGYIHKRIRFEDKGKIYVHTEKVRAFVKADFKKMFKKVGLEIVDIYGDYNIGKYNKKTSSRLILVVKKV